MRGMRRIAFCCAIGCGPGVDTPADTDSGDGDDSRTGPMSDPGTSASSITDGSGPAVTTGGLILDVGGGGTGGPGCYQTREVGPLRTSVMVLVDASQTMVTQTLDHDGDARTPEVSRWAVVVGALQARLPALVDIADVGLQVFPAIDAAAPPDADACRTNDDGLPPPSSADAMLDELPPSDADTFAGASPAIDALARANTMLPNDPGVDRRLLLLTDSAPNCNIDAITPEQLFEQADDGARDLVESMAAQGIVTHVIGIDVPEGTFGGGPEGDALTDHRARLEELAAAGGPALVLAPDAAIFDNAIADFTSAAWGCRLRIPPDLLGGEIIEIGLGYELVDILPVLEAEVCAAGERGYRYLEPRLYDTVEFCGTACEEFQLSGSATVFSTCFYGPE